MAPYVFLLLLLATLSHIAKAPPVPNCDCDANDSVSSVTSLSETKPHHPGWFNQTTCQTREGDLWKKDVLKHLSERLNFTDKYTRDALIAALQNEKSKLYIDTIRHFNTLYKCLPNNTIHLSNEINALDNDKYNAIFNDMWKMSVIVTRLHSETKKQCVNSNQRLLDSSHFSTIDGHLSKAYCLYQQLVTDFNFFWKELIQEPIDWNLCRWDKLPDDSFCVGRELLVLEHLRLVIRSILELIN